MKGRGANGLRPAAAAAARRFGGASTATAFGVQPSCAALPSRDGAGERRVAAALPATGYGWRTESRAGFGWGIFRDGGCRQCRLPDPAPLDGVGVVITGRHVGGLLAIVARVKPIAVIVAVESSRHSFRRRLPGWAATAGTGAPARNLGGRVHARSGANRDNGKADGNRLGGGAPDRETSPVASANDPPPNTDERPLTVARKATANGRRAARRKAPRRSLQAARAKRP
jgi:hypothetical protein